MRDGSEEVEGWYPLGHLGSDWGRSCWGKEGGEEKETSEERGKLEW